MINLKNSGSQMVSRKRIAIELLPFTTPDKELLRLEVQDDERLRNSISHFKRQLERRGITVFDSNYNWIGTSKTFYYAIYKQK